MNFGQHWRTPKIQDIAYSVTLPVSFFADILNEKVPEYVDDAIKHPDLDDSFENILRSSGWPSTEQILANHELAQMWLKYLGHEILLKWFGDGAPETLPGFVINTVESVGFDNSHPVLAGKGRVAGVAVAYQDF